MEGFGVSSWMLVIVMGCGITVVLFIENRLTVLILLLIVQYLFSIQDMVLLVSITLELYRTNNTQIIKVYSRLKRR